MLNYPKVNKLSKFFFKITRNMPTDFPQKKTSYSNNNEKKNKYINKENINYVSDPKKCP